MVGTLRRGCEGGKEIPGRAGRLAVGRAVAQLREHPELACASANVRRRNTEDLAGELLQRASCNTGTSGQLDFVILGWHH